MRTLHSIVLFAALSGALASAQQPDSGPPPSGPHPGQMDQGHGPWSDMRGLHIGPPGMWWHNPDLVQKLTLTPDQLKRMDDIFQQNRSQLMDLRTNLENQEKLMGPMLAADQPDTNKILAQIDHTAQARAELEKATARMLLGLRNILTPDQWSKLQAAEQENRRTRMRFGQPPGGQGNPHGTPPQPPGPTGGEGQ
jgi:Spy/CpxP family protein refolding chaperone